MKKLILSCCLFITACNICVSQDLVAFYPFNNNADDESGNDYHGVVYGATLATDRYGNENSAYSFNGDDYIDIPITGLNQETGSIILWFQISGVDYSYQKVFFSISNNASENITSFYSGIDQRTGLSDSRLLSLVNIEELGSSRWQLWVPESQFNSQTDYNWNHLAVIQDGVETKMYLNGNFVGSFGVSNDLTAWWSDLLSAANPSTVATIGHLRRNGALVDNIGFNGKVDDILIYNRALTEQEILDLYNGTVTVTSPNGGETWTGLSTQDITWNSANTSGNLTIEFSGNNGADWDTIMASTPDVGSFSWTLPEGSYTECLIRISDTDGESEDVSDAVFIIQHSVNPFASNPIVEYRHWGIDQQYELYGLHLRLNVADPQGLENIVSVTVTTPGSIVYNLYDDGQHSDNEASDGYFGYDAWNLNDEPLSGEYVFVVTDAEANNDTVVDILDHTIDIPRNVQPANNSIVTTATPTFSWDEVSGATSYRVNVHDGLTQLWHRDDISTASIQYNNNGTGQPLEEGKIYYWNVNAVIDDAETWHDENRFIYSSNTNNPVVANPQVRSMHRGDDFGNESYGLELYLDVMDPQDLADISSVTVTSPNSDAYTLYDDGQHNDDGANDGRYGNHIWNLNQAPPMGEYLFTATDNSANTDTAIDNLDLVLDYPRNLHPTYNEFITTLHPEFSWDPVAGVTTYWITVRDEFNNEIWSSSTSGTSIIYNYNSTGADLTDGKYYTWDINTNIDDASSWHDTWRFIYSTAPMLTVGVPQTSETLTIDGSGSDNIWNSASSTRVLRLAEGSFNDSADFYVDFKMCWNDVNLYLLFEVTDDMLYNSASDPWQNDAIEIYFDMNNSRNVYYPGMGNWTAYDYVDDYQIRFEWGKPDITGYPPISGITSAYTTNPASDGYQYEIAIPWSSLGLPVAGIGVNFGFDMNIIDRDGGDVRDAVVNWNSPFVESWRDPSMNGIAELRNNSNEMPAEPALLARCNGYYGPSGSTISLNAGIYSGPYDIPVTIKNIGQATLENIVAIINGPGYSMISTPASNLGSNESSSFTVRLDTNYTGSFSADLNITSNDPLSPYNVTLITSIIGLPDTLGIRYTEEIITLDGSDTENIWQTLSPIAMNRIVEGPEVTEPDDLSVAYKSCWDINNLYFYVDIKDEVLHEIQTPGMEWNYDNVEFFFDMNNSRNVAYSYGVGDAYDQDDRQIRFNYNSNTLSGINVPEGIQFTQALRPGNDGYILEIAFPWSSLGIPAGGVGVQFGFSVWAEDNDGTDRENILSWYASTLEAWYNPSLWGIGMMNDENGSLPVSPTAVVYYDPYYYPDGYTMDLGTSITSTTSQYTFQLKNIGQADLENINVTMTGDGYSLASLPAVALGAQQQSDFSVYFTPDHTGSYGGTLEISSNDPTSPYIIHILHNSIDAPELEYETDANTVLLLHMNELAGPTVYDYSGYGNHGHVVAGTSVVDGKYGKARYFNGGGDYIEVYNTPELDITDSITIEAWLYDEGAGGFAAKYDGPLSWDMHEGAFFISRDGVENDALGYPRRLNEWIHLAATYDGLEQKVYINGELVASREWPGSIASSNSRITIGTHADQWYRGIIDEVRLSNKVRTPDEFNIPPFIDITSPSGGDTWYAGATCDITWNSFGTSGNMMIDFSANNGIDWTPVIASTPDNGSYSWTVPGEISSECMIRISDIDGHPAETLSAAFTISEPLERLTATLPKIFTNITIDGNPLKMVWDTLPQIQIERMILSETDGFTGPEDLSAYWKACYNDDGLYVLVHVTADDIHRTDYSYGEFWEQDRIEVYVDMNSPNLYDAMGPSTGVNMGQSNNGHYQVATLAEPNDPSHEWEPGSTKAVKLYPDNTYTYEVFIPWVNIPDINGIVFEPDDEKPISMDIIICDNDGTESDQPRHRMVWSNTGVVNEAWYNMDDCGTVDFEISTTPVDSSRFAWYPFNGNTDDASGNNHQGTNNNVDFAADRFGLVNSSGFFDGYTSYVAIENSEEFNLADSLTVSAWIKSNGFINIMARIVTNWHLTYEGYEHYTVTLRTNGSVDARIDTDQISLPYYFDDIQSWHLVSLVYKNPVLRLYVDNKFVQMDTAYTDGYDPTNNVPVIIGGGGSWNNTMPTYIFSGEIDDVSFYRKALSDDDINRLYQNYHPPKVFQAIPDNGQVTLRWSAEQMNRLSQIRIFRNDGLLESLEVNSPDDTAFVDTQVTNGQSYHYYITTVDTMNYESMPSEMVEVMPAVLLPEEYTADANTVMLLHMNESSGSMVYDFSGNNNNGTINGSVAGNGKMGKAREFYYSNDQVSIEDDPSLHFGTEPYTIEFWLKTQPGSGGHPLHKRGNTTSGTTGRGWFTNIGNNKISITIYNDPALDGEDGSTHFESNTIIADNAWHHIAFIIGTESIQCYIDGMLDNETTIHWPGSSDNDGIIEIGATSHTGDFTGVLDEIRISNKARTPEEFNVFPYMMVTAPKTGDSWQIGFEREITWEAIGTSGNVHIEYSVDNGSTWTDVISSTPDDGSCNWMVPNEPTSMGMIRVSDAAGSLSDETDGTFSINTVEDCLVAYYPFNGNANDESGRGNNGILEGTVLCSDRFGNPDNAFSFDGMDDRIYVENIDDFKFTSYTFTGWMKTSKCPSTEQWIVGKNQDDNTSKYNYGVVLQPNMAVKSEYESCFYEYDHIQSSEPMQLNDWVFFAAVRDNSTGRHTLYVNGENTGSYVWYNTPCNNDQQFNIGSRNNIAWFNGIIDDIRVYNCALDSSLINAFYTEGGYAPVSAPTNFTAVPENGQILLSWEASEVVNLHKYNIYRDNDDLSVFIYDSTTGTPPDTFYLDTNIETGRMYYYLLSTVDDAGNESSMAFDRCQVPDTVNVLYKTEPMTIDGIGDESLWQNMDPITITHVIEGLVDDAADLSATFKAYWDTDSIYFLVEVTDDSLYNGDGSAWVNDAVELYFDMNNSKNENIEKLSWDQVYDGDDRQIRFVWEGDITGQNIPEGIRYAFTTNEDRHGYVLELSVSALDLSFPYDGFFGFDIDIIDNDDTGDRQAIMAWNSYAVENYRDPSRNGIAIMADFHEIISETHFTTVWTGNGWEQMNLYALTATIDGVDMQPGDEIAVFDGEYCVGAGVLTEVLNGTTTYLMFIASHNDAEPPDVNGFEEGHEIIFRLWDVSEQAEVTTVEAIYTAGTGQFEPNGTAAFYLSGITTLEQSIPLTAGWNIFSLAVDPEETTIPEIVQSLVNESSLIKVQDEAGHAYEYVFPIGWTNNIPAWSMTEGYKIKVNFTTTLVVTGAPVPLPVEIPLITGWNVIGYPALEQQSIQGVLSELISSNHLIKVQDEAGMAIEYVFPIGWVDKIVNFRPGEGYKVKVNTDDAITIDEPGSLKSTFSEKMKDVSPVHFKPVYEGYGLDHMNIYLTSAKLNGKPLETGDEVGLFDDDRCVGAGVVRSDELPYLSLVASKDDPETGEADGFIAGNPITLRIWSNRYALELRVDNLSFFTGYCDTFDPLATTVASFNLTASGLPGSDGWTTSLGDNYPNPFSDETTLEFTLGEMSVVDISVYNLMGEKVKTLVHQSMASGSYKTIWDASDQRDAKVPPGIYLCKMIAGNNIFVKPMEVIR